MDILKNFELQTLNCETRALRARKAKTLWQAHLPGQYLLHRSQEAFMRSLLTATLLLALLTGCTIHEPVYQIVYAPDTHLTNNVDFVAPQVIATAPAAPRASR